MSHALISHAFDVFFDIIISMNRVRDPKTFENEMRRVCLTDDQHKKKDDVAVINGLLSQLGESA